MPYIGTSAAMKQAFIVRIPSLYSGPLTVTDNQDENILDYKNGQFQVAYVLVKEPLLKFYQVKYG